MEDAFFRQKSGCHWLHEGDKSTGFFHSYVRQRRKKSHIAGTLIDGDWITDKQKVSESAVSFFETLFQDEGSSSILPTMEDCIPMLITQDDNHMLMAAPTLVEVHDAVFGLNKNSAAGVDGFHGVFYHAFWDVIQGDLLEAMVAFFQGSRLPKGATSTTICLIPKVQGARAWGQFRPISLCTFFNKVATKIISSRLGLILPRIISPMQAGFVTGRSIYDNIMLAQELTHELDRPVGGGNVIMKLDMTKAFDRLSWQFLSRVLEAFGFSQAWILLILRCIDQSWFSVMINGELQGYFHASKGVRQGDPLSPALFIIAQEYLLRGLAKVYSEHPEVRYDGGSSVVVPCLAFADDCIIFCNGRLSSVNRVMDWLDHYQTLSGQLINKEKSSCIFSSKKNTARTARLIRATGFRKESVPFTYLGTPIYKGRKSCFLFNNLVEKLSTTIAGWASTKLSHGGRLVLLQSVLLARPLHLLHTMHMPAKIVTKIQNMCNGFLWGKSRWARWEAESHRYDEGGLSLKSLTTINQVCKAKAWHRFRKGDSLWSQFMFAKYCKRSHPADRKVHPSHSRCWKFITQGREYAEANMHWILGQGDCRFWHDSWTNEGTLTALEEHDIDDRLKVCDVWLNGEWDVDKLRTMVDAHSLASIISTPIHSGADILVWKNSGDGLFSFREAYRALAPSRETSPVFSSMWHSTFPATMSFHAWRTYKGIFPVDDRLQRRGTQLASKCVHCENYETIDHVFLHCPIAVEVWSTLGSLFGLYSGLYHSIHHIFAVWSLSTACKGHIRHLLPIVALYAIWEARNRTKHEGVPSLVQQILHRINWIIRMWCDAGFGLATRWKGHLEVARLLKYQVVASVKRPPMLVGWVRPPRGRCKLNVDGSFGMTHSGAGGVLRDEEGSLVVAISMPITASSPLEAEIESMITNLRWSIANSYSYLQVETDSLQLVQAIEHPGGPGGPWNLRSKIMLIRSLLQDLHAEVTHVWRECNNAADYMAKHAASHHITTCWRQGEETSQLRALIRLEQIGIPYVRR